MKGVHRHHQQYSLSLSNRQTSKLPYIRLSPRLICRKNGVCGSPAANAGVAAGTRPRACWLGGIGVLNVADSSCFAASTTSAAAAVDMRVDRRVARALVVVPAPVDAAAVDIRVDRLVLLRSEEVAVAAAAAAALDDDCLAFFEAVAGALVFVRLPRGFRFLLLRRAVLGGGGGGISMLSMLSNFSVTFSF